MRILHGLEGLLSLPAGSVLSVGNYDGIHLGHRKILSIARDLAGPDRIVAVATFEPHTLSVLRPHAAPPRLAPFPIKVELLKEAGVDRLVVLPANRQTLSLRAEDFWGILRDRVRPAHLVEGESFSFGAGRSGSIDQLAHWSAGSGVQVHSISPAKVDLCDHADVVVSSSLTRWMLLHGRARDGAICLGRPYQIHGDVVRGFQRGQSLGFPTANLRVMDQLVPGDGVYAARAWVGDTAWPAALSIGTMPTLGANGPRQIEAHLLGFAGDLYGKTLRVDLLDWVREQRRFPGVDALREQLERDCQAVADRADTNAGV